MPAQLEIAGDSGFVSQLSLGVAFYFLSLRIVSDYLLTYRTVPGAGNDWHHDFGRRVLVESGL
jgi:hypothetical protein